MSLPPDYRAKQQKRIRQKRKALGLCMQCGKPTDRLDHVKCAPCRAKNVIDNKRRRLADPDKFRRQGRESNKRGRLEAIQAYGGRCICCGETHAPYLQFDHINNDGHMHRRQDRKLLHLILKREGWPDYIQLLCANCHLAKTTGEVCPSHAPVG